MTEQQSELDRLRATNLAQAAERIAITLEAQGVEKIRAQEFVEDRVEFLAVSGARWWPVASEVRSRGTTDEHLVHFARLLHLYHPELGGKPEPFGTDPGPPSEGATDQAARIATARQDAQRVREELAIQQAAFAKQRDEAFAVHALSRAADPTSAF